MIIVTGEILAKPETRDDIIILGQRHSARSRAEPGCLLHELHSNTENPCKLVFVEHWADEDSLRRHFAVPDSRAFARAVSKLASEPPIMNLYHAKALPV